MKAFNKTFSIIADDSNKIIGMKSLQNTFHFICNYLKFNELIAIILQHQLIAIILSLQSINSSQLISIKLQVN